MKTQNAKCRMHNESGGKPPPRGSRPSTLDPRPSFAFTLLEIVFAIALFALVVAAMYSSWLTIVRGKKAGEKVAADVQRSRIAVHTIEEALTSVRAYAADIQYYAFIGEGGDNPSLSFVSRLTPSFPRSGKFGAFDVRRVTFALEPGANFNEGKQLILRQNLLLMDMDVDEKEHPLVLAKNVKDMKFQFLDPHTMDWAEEWTQTNQLPSLVKITLQMGDQWESSPQNQLTRVIALPSVLVQAGWQGGSLNPALNNQGQFQNGAASPTRPQAAGQGGD